MVPKVGQCLADAKTPSERRWNIVQDKDGHSG